MDATGCRQEEGYGGEREEDGLTAVFVVACGEGVIHTDLVVYSRAFRLFDFHAGGAVRPAKYESMEYILPVK